MLLEIQEDTLLISIREAREASAAVTKKLEASSSQWGAKSYV